MATPAKNFNLKVVPLPAATITPVASKASKALKYFIIGLIAASAIVLGIYKFFWLPNLMTFATLLAVILFSNTRSILYNISNWVTNPDYFIYAFIGLSVLFYTLVVYYIFDFEKAIQTGRLLQLECSNTSETFEKETVRYSVAQYFNNEDKYKIIYWISLALTIAAQIAGALWLVRKPRGITAFAGLYVVFWIAIILFSVYIADYDSDKKELVNKMNVFAEEKTNIDRITDFFKFYLSDPRGASAKQEETALFKRILDRYIFDKRATNRGAAINALKGDAEMFVSYIDFAKDRNLLMQIISSAVECSDSNTDKAFQFNKLCFGSGAAGTKYKKDLQDSFDYFQNFDYNQFTRKVYDKTARARNPFLLFAVIFIGYFYSTILCEKYSFTQISFASITLIVFLITLIFILRYVGVLVR